jgi:hypothetical protein
MALALAGLCGLLAVGEAAAQQRPAAPYASVLRIRKLPKLGRGLLVRTPEYEHNVTRVMSGSRPRREWAVLDVFYDTSPAWVDELSVAFHVMAEGRTPEGQKQFSFYQVTVAYSDVERGEHVATVVLPPAAIARYGDIVACAVEFFVGGQKVAQESVASIQLPETWWADARVLDNPTLVKRPGYLRDRGKSPFAFANIDDYEAVK